MVFRHPPLFGPIPWPWWGRGFGRRQHSGGDVRLEVGHVKDFFYFLMKQYQEFYFVLKHY